MAVGPAGVKSTRKMPPRGRYALTGVGTISRFASPDDKDTADKRWGYLPRVGSIEQR